MIVRYRGVSGFAHHVSNPSRYLLSECNWEIKLDCGSFEIPASTDTIGGDLEFVSIQSPTEPGKYFDFTELRIQLEGTATSNFTKKIDGRHTNYSKTHRFLPDPDHDPFDPSQWSPLVHHFVRGGRPLSMGYATRGRRGPHSFPFEIKLTELGSLPPTFETANGSISYELVVYADYNLNNLHYSRATESRLIVRDGRLHLSTLTDPLVKQPIFLTKKKESTFSFFSRRPTLIATLGIVEKRGFLVGEDLKCHLDVDNPGCETIGDITILLVQKIIYFVNSMSKMTMTVLDQREFSEVDQLNQFRCETVMRIPLDLIPTFTRKTKSIEILYFVQFNIEVSGKTSLKGETIIQIGTSREDENLVDKEIIKIANEPLASTSKTDWDSLSLLSETTLPPSYSKLTSRQESTETLPPSYEKAEIE